LILPLPGACYLAIVEVADEGPVVAVREVVDKDHVLPQNVLLRPLSVLVGRLERTPGGGGVLAGGAGGRAVQGPAPGYHR
jgi:hypothetical protein